MSDTAVPSVEAILNVGLEFATQIRGREVTCWLDDGRLLGDDELVGRLERLAENVDRFDPLTLAHSVRDAVGSDVHIRFNRHDASS